MSNPEKRRDEALRFAKAANLNMRELVTELGSLKHLDERARECRYNELCRRIKAARAIAARADRVAAHVAVLARMAKESK